MFGTSTTFEYDWGVDPARGDPVKHWRYHQPIYRECLQVLRHGRVLAWGQGAKFNSHFHRWFGDHRVWLLGRSMETAEALNRKWIGCDRSKRYCQIAIKALAEERHRLALTRGAIEVACHEAI